MFQTGGKHVLMGQQSNERRQANHITLFFWRNARCRPMMIHRRIFHCVTVASNQELVPIQSEGSIFLGVEIAK